MLSSCTSLPPDCSAVTGAVATDDPNAWLRIAFSLTNESGDTEFTVRTPRLNFFRSGISIATNGIPLSKLFVDHCDDTSCTTTVPLSARLLVAFLAADMVTFEYQTSQDGGEIIGMNFEGLGHAMSKMRKVLGLDHELPSRDVD